GDDQRRERPEPVAGERLRDQRQAARRLVEDDPGEHARGDEAGEDDERAEEAAHRSGHEHAAEQGDARRGEQRKGRRKREPVDRGCRDHGVASVWSPRISGKPRSETSAGQAERKSSSPTSGITIASSSGRTSGASSRTSRPRAVWSTAEITRSMYIAARTMPAAPATAQPQATPYTPARIRNSPANAQEPGTASAMIPVVISRVARTGRPRAIPPRPAKALVPVRISTMPARRNI